MNVKISASEAKNKQKKTPAYLNRECIGGKENPRTYSFRNESVKVQPEVTLTS